MPLSIPGSENATIHGVFIGEVVRTLDLITGQIHHTTGDMRLNFDMTDADLQVALNDWRKWLLP